MAEPLQMFSLDEDQTEYAKDVRGPAIYPRTDDQKEEKYATYSRAILDEQRSAMEPLFLTWTQNLLFLAGLQWWEYNRLTGQFEPPKTASWKQHPVRNLLRPFFKHFLAKVTKNRPSFLCVPASTDTDDIHAAELGDDVLKAKFQELHVSEILRRAIAWVIPTGNAFIMPYWNLESGQLMPLTTLVPAVVHDRETGQAVGQEVMEVPCDETGEPILDENGNYDIMAEPAYIDMGDVGYKVFSPFQVFIDAGADCDEEITHYMIAEPLTLREIYRRWPESQGEVVGEDTTMFERWDQMIVGMAAGADTHMVASEVVRDIEVQKAMVLHYYERKSEEFPMGRHWVSVGTKLLEAPGPLPDGVWPVMVWLKDIEVPGRAHAEATLTDVVGLQREYNEINAQIKEHHNLLLRGKWLVPIGSNIRRGQITTQPGEVIQHTPGLPPKQADLRPLPAEVYREREQVMADFQMITGMHQISMGQPPPGVTSGRAFLTLQEADDTDLGPFLEMLESRWAQLAWLTLQIVQQFYDEERLVRVAGENHRYKVRAFSGADLTSIVDVEPQSGSSYPWNAVAKQSMMIELAQSLPMLFTDPETGMFDHERFRKLLPVGGTEAIGMSSDLDVAEALREHEEFEMWAGEMSQEGMPQLPQVLPWQNHMIHIRQHGNLLKSASFKRWPPENQMALIEHWQQTQMLIMQQMMAAQENQENEDEDEGGPPPEGSEA